MYLEPGAAARSDGLRLRLFRGHRDSELAHCGKQVLPEHLRRFRKVLLEMPLAFVGVFLGIITP